MEKKKFVVEGMTCSACVSHVNKAVCKVKGVKEVNVNLLTKSMDVEIEDLLGREPIILDNSSVSSFIRNKVVLEITFYSSVRETSRKLGVLLLLIVSRETQISFLVNTVFCQIHVICVVFLT